MPQPPTHSSSLDMAPREPLDLSSGKYVKLWQGPQHPGITGNMSLELTLCGDEIVECKTHVGYLHRGFEKFMERRTFIQNFTVVCRIAVPEPTFNEYLYSAAVEELAGIEVPERANWLRALNLEMMRLASFLMWTGGMSGAFGLYTVPNWTLTYRDYILDLFEELTGARIYHMYIVPGGVRNPLPDGWKEKTLEILKGTEKLMREVDRVMLNNAVFKARAKGLGVITPDMIDPYGIVGPNARACGFTNATCAKTNPTWCTISWILTSSPAAPQTPTNAPSYASRKSTSASASFARCSSARPTVVPSRRACPTYCTGRSRPAKPT
jgi:NADH-quinone oxidoreductase subunit D